MKTIKNILIACLILVVATTFIACGNDGGNEMENTFVKIEMEDSSSEYFGKTREK